MEACDLRGKTINVGSYARYTGTGTTGQVSDIKEENHNQWAKLENSDLWYSLDTIEVITKEDIKNVANKYLTENYVLCALAPHLKINL